VRLRHVTKSFGRTRAVDDVSLDVAAGEIVGLVGENGAGKTTLMRIVAGELKADSGTIELDCSPHEVGFVHQHFLLVNAFTIAENLALVVPERPAEEIVGASGIELRDVTRRANELSVGEKSKLELIKAVAKNPKILILDEPTSVLAPAEAAELFDVMRRLAGNGTAVVFISHKIPEVLAVATRIVVMRRGKLVPAGTTAEEIAESMLERRRPAGWRGAVPAPGPVVVSVDDLTVSAGEIVAVIGVAGNGQSALAARVRETTPGRVGEIPEDRTRDGLVAEMSIAENVALRERRWNAREAAQRASRLIDLFNIRAQSPRQPAGSLSGGNQQKVILARELERNPDVLIASEPTRGLDIDATQFVHEKLRAAADRGAAIVLITSDLDEAFSLADAIHVIYRGRLSERMSPQVAAERAAAMMGGVA